MYCGDWEKGANRIVAHQRKWLLQRNCNICKIQAHRPFHASSIGVVTCVGEQRYVPFSQSPQYISDPQHGGGQTDVYVYGSDQNVTSHAMGVCWIVTVGGAPEGTWLLGGKRANLRETDFTAVDNLKTLWLFYASCGPVHNKGVLQDALWLQLLITSLGSAHRGMIKKWRLAM